MMMTVEFKMGCWKVCTSLTTLDQTKHLSDVLANFYLLCLMKENAYNSSPFTCCIYDVPQFGYAI